MQTVLLTHPVTGHTTRVPASAVAQHQRAGWTRATVPARTPGRRRPRPAPAQTTPAAPDREPDAGSPDHEHESEQ